MRIKNPYVIQTELIQETGIEKLDEYLYCLVNILHLGVGEFLRSVFLIGSYAHGGHTPDSDVDCCFVWKEKTDPTQMRKGLSLVVHLGCIVPYVIDPMYNATEMPFYDAAAFSDTSCGEYPCGPLLKLGMKEHSLLLWGEDIRPKIALSRQEDILRDDVISAPLNWIKQTHYGSLDATIVYPLTDPSPEKEDAGYGDLHGGTVFVIHIARALIFLETGEFLFNKMNVVDGFETHVGGAWSGFVRDILDVRYSMLSEEEAQRKYRHACKKMTEFQNYFLERIIEKDIGVSMQFSS